MELIVASGTVGAGSHFGLLTVIVVCTLVTSFVCSICEAALYAISQTRVEQLAESGSARGRRLQRLRRDVTKPIAAILTLNTISNTVGATLAGWVASGAFDSVGVGIFSALFTLAILYLSEIIPKTAGVLYADALAPHLALLVQWMIWVFWPLVWACQWVKRIIPHPDSTMADNSEEDLLVMARVGHRSGSLRADEARWVQNALKLDRLKVSDVLTPRTMVVSMDRHVRIEEALRTPMTAPYSRIPVTEDGNLDRIVGIVLQRDIRDAETSERGRETLSDIMRPPTFVPEAMKVGDLLAKFLDERRHLFIVADEYGGTAGVVTLEDALESLLGSEIVDEYDRVEDLQRLARREASRKMNDRPAGANPDSGTSRD